MATGNIGLVLSVVVGVAGVVVTLVAPLYYLVLDIRESDAASDQRRENIADNQDELDSDIEQMMGEVRQLRVDVNENSLRAETNQRHLHQLLVAGSDGEAPSADEPHHSAEECPLPDECPWHGADAG